jgi:hypothetical protein
MRGAEPAGIARFSHSLQLSHTMKNRVDQNDVSIESINPWGKNYDWRVIVRGFVSPARKPVEEQPAEELNQMWSRNATDPAPNNSGVVPLIGGRKRITNGIANSVGVESDPIVMLPGKAFY